MLGLLTASIRLQDAPVKDGVHRQIHQQLSRILQRHQRGDVNGRHRCRHRPAGGWHFPLVALSRPVRKIGRPPQPPEGSFQPKFHFSVD